MATNSDGIIVLMLGFGLGAIAGAVSMNYAENIRHVQKARVQGTTTEYIIVEKNDGHKSYYAWSPAENKYTLFEPTTLVNKVEGELEKKVEKRE